MLQILCTCLTFLGALILLIGNQWFTDRHKHTEILVGKAQQLYESLIRLADLGLPEEANGKSLVESQPIFRAQGKKALSEVRACSMLVSLYFPRLHVVLHEMTISSQNAYTIMYKFDGTQNMSHLLYLLEIAHQKIIKMQDAIFDNVPELTQRIFPSDRDMRNQIVPTRVYEEIKPPAKYTSS